MSGSCGKGLHSFTVEQVGGGGIFHLGGPPHPYSVDKVGVFMDLERGCRRKVSFTIELAAESSPQRTCGLLAVSPFRRQGEGVPSS
jgi:hypothetical protein